MLFRKLFRRKAEEREGENVPMKLVVGLGNPGEKYERTRHNVGFEVIDQCQKHLNIDLKEAKFKGALGSLRSGSEKIFFLKPLTYMNLSGESVRQLMAYYKIEPDDLLVIYDDLDLPPGRIRLRQKGSHGGHNGMKSIMQHIGTDRFNRIRIGIGRPGPGMDIPEYVLGTFSPQDRQQVDEAVDQASAAVQMWTEQDFPMVMNKYN